MSRIIAIVVACLVLGGCAISMQPAVPYDAHYKKPAPGSSFGMYPHNYKELTVEKAESVLKDPESARYRFEPPRKAYLCSPSSGDVRWQGYLVKVAINAKNSYGGYTGFTPYLVSIRNGKAEEIGADGGLMASFRVLDEPAPTGSEVEVKRPSAAVGGSK